MSNTTLPKLIDLVKLADHEASIEGELLPEWFSTRFDGLLQSVEHVYAELQFSKDEERRRVVNGTVKASVVQTCQRCLGPLSQEIEITIHAGLVFDEEKARQLPNSLEPWIVEPDQKSDVVPFIEDEIILGISDFAAHPQSECQIQTEFLDDRVPVVTEAEQQSESKKHNPFSKLAQLKKEQD